MLLDCDVEEPNAHVFLHPEINTTTSVCKQIPRIDFEKCTYCGKCAEVCQYNAIAVINQNVLVFPELCHSCGGCTLLCPEGAISEEDQPIGVVERGQAGQIEFVYGRLNVREAMGVPIIRAVKQTIHNQPRVIIDAPPGTSCPVVSTLLGSDYCLLVTEPTPFGLHDLQLAVEVVQELQIPHGVIINRADIGDNKVEEYCQAERIPILMRIPTDRQIAEAYSRGQLFVEALPQYREQFQQVLTACEQKARAPAA